MKITNAMINDAKRNLTCTAEDGKVFQPIEEAYFDQNAYSGASYYIATAISPDDHEDGDGNVPVYEIKFAITNPEAEEAENACDWSVVDDYKQVEYMAAEDAKVLLK